MSKKLSEQEVIDKMKNKKALVSLLFLIAVFLLILANEVKTALSDLVIGLSNFYLFYISLFSAAILLLIIVFSWHCPACKIYPGRGGLFLSHCKQCNAKFK